MKHVPQDRFLRPVHRTPEDDWMREILDAGSIDVFSLEWLLDAVERGGPAEVRDREIRR